MKLVYQLWTFLVLGILPYSALTAQSDYCSAVLDNKAYNKTDYSQTREYYASFYEHVCKTEFDSKQSAKNSANSFGLNIEIDAMPIGAKSSNSSNKTNYSYRESKFCKEINDNLTILDDLKFSKVNTNVAVNAWLECHKINNTQLYYDYKVLVNNVKGHPRYSVIGTIYFNSGKIDVDAYVTEFNITPDSKKEKVKCTLDGKEKSIFRLFSSWKLKRKSSFSCDIDEDIAKGENIAITPVINLGVITDPIVVRHNDDILRDVELESLKSKMVTLDKENGILEQKLLDAESSIAELNRFKGESISTVHFGNAKGANTFVFKANVTDNTLLVSVVYPGGHLTQCMINVAQPGQELGCTLQAEAVRPTAPSGRESNNSFLVDGTMIFNKMTGGIRFKGKTVISGIAEVHYRDATILVLR